MSGILTDGLGREFRVERLGPGVYVDDQGGMHFVATEILEAFAVEDTEENRKKVMEMVLETFRESGLDKGAKIDVIDTDGTRRSGH